jgi:hypothetical protein
MNTLFDIALLFKDVGHWFEKGFAALLALIIGWTGGGQTILELAEGKAFTATRQEYVYDNERLLLGAYNFTNPDEDTVRWAKEAGLDFMFTLMSNIFDGNDDPNATLRLLKKYGLGGMDVNHFRTGTRLDLIEEDLLDTFWGQALTDEPHAREFENLAEQARAFYEEKPGRTPQFCLLPIYAGPSDLVDDWSISWARWLFLLESPWSRDNILAYRKYMAQYVSTIDMDNISQDIYPYHWDENGEVETNARWLFGLQAQAEACRDTGRDMWVITQAGGDGPNKDGAYTGTTLAEQNQQNFASLAFGTKCIVYAMMRRWWFESESVMLNDNNERTPTYYSVQAANKELAPFAKVYGEYKWKNAYLENMRRVAGIHYPILGLSFLPNNIWNLPNPLPAEERLDLVTKDGLLIGKFDKIEGDGSAWVITNMMELKESKSAQFTVRFDRPATVYLEGETLAYEAGLHSFTLAPGGGMFMTM